VSPPPSKNSAIDGSIDVYIRKLPLIQPILSATSTRFKQGCLFQLVAGGIYAGIFLYAFHMLARC